MLVAVSTFETEYEGHLAEQVRGADTYTGRSHMPPPTSGTYMRCPACLPARRGRC